MLGDDSVRPSTESACLASFLRAAAKLDEPGVAERAEAVVPPTEVIPRLGDTWLSGGTVAVVRLIELTMVSGGGFVPAVGTPPGLENILAPVL
jgi:hypothetical protein